MKNIDSLLRTAGPVVSTSSIADQIHAGSCQSISKKSEPKLQPTPLADLHRRGELSMLMPEHGVFSAYLALTFKHAVEFSSFGCTPRDCHFDSRLGLTRLTLFGPTLGVKSKFLTFSAFLDPICFRNFRSFPAVLTLSVPCPESNPSFGSELLSDAILFQDSASGAT